MNSVRDAYLVGIGLCAAVIALFLKSPRVGILAALTVPVTLAITFLAMRLAQQTLNLMSLGGMAGAIGLARHRPRRGGGALFGPAHRGGDPDAPRTAGAPQF